MSISGRFAPPPQSSSLGWKPLGCAHCFRSPSPELQFSRCGGCKIVPYCSRECQKADRVLHKELCGEIIAVPLQTGWSHGMVEKALRKWTDQNLRYLSATLGSALRMWDRNRANWLTSTHAVVFNVSTGMKDSPRLSYEDLVPLSIQVIPLVEQQIEGLARVRASKDPVRSHVALCSLALSHGYSLIIYHQLHMTFDVTKPGGSSWQPWWTENFIRTVDPAYRREDIFRRLRSIPDAEREQQLSKSVPSADWTGPF